MLATWAQPYTVLEENINRFYLVYTVILGNYALSFIFVIIITWIHV